MAKAEGLPSDSPLAKAAFSEIQKGLAAVAAGRKYCDLAEAAGIDCEEWKSVLEMLQRRAEDIKRVYFPDRA